MVSRWLHLLLGIPAATTVVMLVCLHGCTHKPPAYFADDAGSLEIRMTWSNDAAAKPLVKLREITRLYLTLVDTLGIVHNSSNLAITPGDTMGTTWDGINEGPYTLNATLLADLNPIYVWSDSVQVEAGKTNTVDIAADDWIFASDPQSPESVALEVKGELSATYSAPEDRFQLRQGSVLLTSTIFSEVMVLFEIEKLKRLLPLQVAPDITEPIFSSVVTMLKENGRALPAGQYPVQFSIYNDVAGVAVSGIHGIALELQRPMVELESQIRTYSFTTPIGTSETRNFVVRNRGNSQTLVKTKLGEGAEAQGFELSDMSPTLPVGEEDTTLVEFVFNPQSEREVLDTLTVEWTIWKEQPDTTVRIALSGKGTITRMQVLDSRRKLLADADTLEPLSASLSFGQLPAGRTLLQRLYVTNKGTNDLAVWVGLRKAESESAFEATAQLGQQKIAITRPTPQNIKWLGTSAVGNLKPTEAFILNVSFSVQSSGSRQYDDRLVVVGFPTGFTDDANVKREVDVDLTGQGR